MTARADLERLLADLEPKVRDAFLAAIRNQAARIDLKALTAAIERGDIAAAVEIAGLKPRDVFTIAESLRNAYFSAGGIVGNGGRGVLGQFQFDGNRPEAAAWAAENSAALITRLTEESRDAVRATVAEGLDGNRSAQAVARDIAGKRVGNVRVGSIVGLTGPQATSIARSRVGLASGDPGELRYYLKLALRDKRFDKMIRKAIKEGRGIKEPDLSRILQAHKVKALGYRAKVIAQAETFKASAAGQYQAHLQMLAMDGVTGVTVRWQHNLSAEPRVEHVAMGGTVVQIGQPFIFPDGTVMLHPHDPSAPASHVIGCKCIAVYRVQVPRG